MKRKRSGWTWFGFGACAVVCNACLVEGEYLPDLPMQVPGSGIIASSRLPRCGDGVRHESEACDDGNEQSNDGCSADCQVEMCFTCSDDGDSRRSVCGPLCDESAGFSCFGGACVSCSDGIANGDETDVDCGGACGPCALSLRCNGVDDCASGFCSNGVCCNEACDGVCIRCDLTDSPGICSFVAENESHESSDPALVCNGASACDGKGACKNVSGASCTAGIQCISGKCVDGGCL